MDGNTCLQQHLILATFLASENIDTCPLPTDTNFTSIRYPSEQDVRYTLSLITATRNRVQSMQFPDSLSKPNEEKMEFLQFLESFELEIVRLGVWKYAQDGSWDSAVAYCTYTAEQYPVLKDDMSYVKESISSRPRLKLKSPGVAGTMSAIIPGAGQTYAGELSDGLLYLIGEGILAGCAAYLLRDVNVHRDRRELVFGVTFSITAVFTHIANIKDAVQKAKDYNGEQRKSEINLFADSLRISPPGYGR